MYLEAEFPTANENETMRVDMETNSGHLRIQNDKVRMI